MPQPTKFRLKGRLNVLAVLLLGLCFACGDDDSTPRDAAAQDTANVDTGSQDTGPQDTGPQDTGPQDTGSEAEDAPDAGCALPAPDVVTFTTDDGLTLEGDYYAGSAGGPAVILLHMIPPANTRANYGPAIREALVCRGLSVLAIDRRGAGASEGDPREAYEGPNGALDAKGAIEWLLTQPLAPDPSRIGIVGASNGTTTLLDFSVFSVMARTVEEPAALVLLSGGPYTTAQNELDEAALAGAPALFVYPAAESAWNETVAATAPDAWQFIEVDPGAHGTGLFTAEPTTILTVADFLADALR